MADHGYLILTAQNITAGTVIITPATTPVVGTSRVSYERHSRLTKNTSVSESPRVTAVDGDTLVVTLTKYDRVGYKLCWTSYE